MKRGTDLFPDFPDASRVWIFTGDHHPDAETAEQIKKACKEFLSSWTAHQKELHAAAELLDGGLLLIAVNEQVAGASGCSLDKLHNFIRALSSSLSINFFDRHRVLVKRGSELFNVSFRELSQWTSSELNGLEVYDPLISNCAELRLRFPVLLTDTWIYTYILNFKPMVNSGNR